jgi:glycosyltransferase 2 family protein
MHRVIDAIQVFFDHLADVALLPLALGLGLHVVKTMCTSRAWRNVIAAAYPDERVRWRSIWGAYLAGVGVNAIVPARGGDVLRLFLAHRAVPVATYTTLASTYLVMAMFDTVVALAIFGYALTLGVLPSIHTLPHLPSFDFSWLFRHREVNNVLIVVLLAGLVAFGVWAHWRIEDFWARVRQAFSVTRPVTRYLRRVAFWQACDWGLRFATIWCFLAAFHVPQTARNALLVQVTQSIATLAPVTPGGVGTEQAFLVYVFGGAVAKTRLLAFSVGMKVSLTVVNVALGFGAIFLTLGTFRFRRTVETTNSDGAVRRPGGV